MNKKKADEIFNKVKAEWIKRHEEVNLDPEKLKQLKMVLKHCPDEDGLKRVSVIGGKTHLVPYEEIILNGLKGTDVEKYPLAEE
jgi:hypothetical protein